MNRILSSVLDFIVIPAAATTAVFALGVLLPQQAEAGEIWIEVHRQMWGKPKPGTVGEANNLWGFAVYIDVESITRKGDFAYYNVSHVYLDENGFTHTDGPVKGNPGELGNTGWEANCRTQMVKVSASEGWVSWSKKGGNAARIACR